MRLFFHFVLIGIHWDEDFLNEMRISLGGLSSFEAITWNSLPEIIRNMKVRKKERQDLAAPANYARFYISKLFPLLDRFIYLDNDIFAIRAVDSLWSEDLGGNVFGLVHDCDQWFRTHVMSLGNYNISHPIVKRLFGDQVMNHSCHPNAGMMLVNQRLFNEGKYLEKIERLARLNQREFLYRLGSQPLVVLTSWNNYSALPEKYNVRKHICDYNLIHGSSSVGQEPVLLHFNGRGRKGFMFRTIIDELYSDRVKNRAASSPSSLSKQRQKLLSITSHEEGSDHSSTLSIRMQRIAEMGKISRFYKQLVLETFQHSTNKFSDVLLKIVTKFKSQYEVLSVKSATPSLKDASVGVSTAGLTTTMTTTKDSGTSVIDIKMMKQKKKLSKAALVARLVNSNNYDGSNQKQQQRWNSTALDISIRDGASSIINSPSSAYTTSLTLKANRRYPDRK
jgi:lipopolysaccharide biosynthesis glycosyltransferase